MYAMKKSKLGRRKVKANFDQDALAPDQEELQFGEHTFIVKRIRKRDGLYYHIQVKGNPLVEIEGNLTKEQLVLKLIEKHREFFTPTRVVHRGGSRLKYEISESAPSTAPLGSTLEDYFYSTNKKSYNNKSYNKILTDHSFKKYRIYK